jgi:hypothetical protein
VIAHHTKTRLLTLLLSSLAGIQGCAGPGSDDVADPAPQGDSLAAAVTTAFPLSTMITGLTWNFSSRVQFAAGSDLWPLTWGADGKVWGGWGDGGGFKGDGTNGRVSIGFGEISGTPPNLTGTNVWGSSPNFASFPATFCGKPEAMLSVSGTIYAWVGSAFNPNTADFCACPGNPTPGQTRLAISTDAGAHFTEAPFTIVHNTGTIVPNGFINFGKDYANARDGFVYLTGSKTGSPGGYLIRVPKASVATMSAWEYFTGLDANGNPIWGAASAAQPFFSDPNFLGAQVTYHPATNRYLLSAGNTIQDLAIYDGPQPWGPWTTVFATHTWGPAGAPFGTADGLGGSFPEPWMTKDGKTIWSAFSSAPPSPVGDALNVMSATLTLGNAGVTITSPIAYAQTQAKVNNRLYTDRVFTVNTLSANLAGGELLQLANDDKFSTAATQLTFTVDHAATVYVAVDATISPRASWLDATWTRDTASVFKWNNAGNTIATFDVYKKAFPAGTVSLGGNLHGTTASAHSNYTVIVH